MLESPLKNLRIINYLLIGLIFFALLLFIRGIISKGISKQIPSTPLLISPLARGDTEGSKEGMGGFAVTKNWIPHQVRNDILVYAPILEQNPFGTPMKLTPLATERQTVGDSFRKKPAALSELSLVGTVVGDKNLSYAIFVVDSTHREERANLDAPGQELFALGKNVYDYGTLTKIEKGWVELTQGANTYTIAIIDPYVKEIQAKTTESLQTSFAKKISEGQYLLDQRKVQQALNNPEQILTDARLLPNIQDGRQEGFRISEVRPGGLYESLGIRNGDILLRVNNLEISNPDVAVQAMSALRGMNTVNLDIIRDGSRITMSYQIR
jgi:general secretion pathway protein C